jgi:class 3 adenylate cyclase
MTGQVALTGKVSHIHDVLADPEYKASGYQKTFGYRTNLGVPLSRDGTKRGTYEFAALGETMNLGARLVSAAGTGEVVISDTIWPDVAREFNAERRLLTLKGIDGPVPAHVVHVEHEG